MQNFSPAECGKAIRGNLRNAPHLIFRKLPLDNFLHSAIRIPQITSARLRPTGADRRTTQQSVLQSTAQLTSSALWKIRGTYANLLWPAYKSTPDFKGAKLSQIFRLVWGRSKKQRDDGTDDGTLSRPRICKALYGTSQGDETGDWTDEDIGLLHLIRLRYSIFSGGQTSTFKLKTWWRTT